MALTPGKAKKMLDDGTVHGRGLTDKQKRYFGAIAGGATPMKKINGGWLDKYAMGGSLPGASGMMYARSNTPPPLYTQSEMKAKSGGRCWSGYKAVAGKTPFSKGSCKKAQDGFELKLDEVVITAPGRKKDTAFRDSDKDGNVVSRFLNTGRGRKRKELFEDMPEFMQVNDDGEYTLDPEQMQRLKNLGITNLDEYNDYFGTVYNRDNALNEYNYLNYYKPQYDDMISSIHGATNEAAKNIMTASSFVPIVRGASMASKVPQAYRYLANSPVGRAASKYIGQPFRRLNNYKPGGGPFSIGNYADAASVGYGGYNIVPDVKELYNNPSLSTAGNVGLDLLSLSPLLNKRFTGAVSGAFRNTPQTSKLNTYYVDQTGRQFNITSPSGASTDALSAAKPNLKSTDLVNFTSTPTAATIANRISKSNSPVARKIIKDELLEISTEASKLREYQREAFRDLSSPEGFQRLVQMEEEYLKSIGYNMNKADVYRPIGDQAKINAEARLREILNANSKNQEAALVAAQMDDLGDEQLMNTISKFFYGKPGKRMYDNASYTKGDMLPIDDLPPWIRREYINTMRNNKGKLPLSTQVRKDPILGGEITIPEIMVGRSWVNNKPIYAHEIIGHGLQKGRKMPQDDWIRNLIEPLDKNSPMWNKNSQKAYEYFMEGSKGREPMAFVQELRQALMDSGIIKNRYDKITPEMIGNAQEFFQTNPMGVFNTSSNSFLSNTRIFDFMSPTSENFKNLSMILNKLPAALPPVIGAGLLGIDKGENQAPPQMKNGGWLDKYEVIEDDMGQLTNPGKITKINSNNITMKGVDFPVLGISDTGDKKMMQPGKDYKFDGNSVTEYPMAQAGYKIPTRQGVRKNTDGSVSTHLMKAEQLEDGTWVGFPSLFQNEDGKWIDMSGEEDWMNIYNEALNRGEVIEFGDDKETAIKFGEGSWKIPKGQEGETVDVSEQIDFLKNWNMSNRGQELLSNSFDGKEKLITDRTNRRNNFLDTVSVEQADGGDDYLGRYNPGRHRIRLDNSLFDGDFKFVGKGLKDVALHELSHSQDYGGGYGSFNKLNMPLSDVKLINSLNKTNIKNLKNNKDLSKSDVSELKYIGDPTEVRARLNAIRYFYENTGLKEEGMPSIFDSEVTPEMQDIMKINDQYKDLNKLYSDDEINMLLNTISDNSQSSGPSNMAYAQGGNNIPLKTVNEFGELERLTYPSSVFKTKEGNPEQVSVLDEVVVTAKGPITSAKEQMEEYGITDELRKSYVKDKSEKAYNNITPQGYGDIKTNLDRYRRFKGNLGRDPEALWYDGPKDDKTYYTIPNREDAFRLYLGMPQTNNSFSVSDYRPGDSEDKSMVYLKPTYFQNPEIRQELLDNYFDKETNKGKRKIGNERGLSRGEWKGDGTPFPDADNALGDFTFDMGEDEKGSYISIYDIWDLNPFNSTGEGSSLNRTGKALLNLFNKKSGKKATSESEVSELFGAGKPFEIYERIYFDPKTKKIIDMKQGGSLVSLDQLTNFTNYNTPQPGGWLDKY